LDSCDSDCTVFLEGAHFFIDNSAGGCLDTSPQHIPPENDP
jgi:hypothetical protein